MDNTYDELVSTIAPIETDKPSSQHDTDNSYYSISSPRTASASALSPSSSLSASLTEYSKSNNRILLIQKVVILSMIVLTKILEQYSTVM